MRSHRNHGHVTLTRLSGDRIIWLYITCSSYLESHLSSRPSFVTRIYIYPCVYTCIRVRLGCVTDALSVRATQRIVGMIERNRTEREKGKEYYVGIQVFFFFLNVSRKHSSIKVLPASTKKILLKLMVIIIITVIVIVLSRSVMLDYT